jgi:hypothetical protein
MNAREWSLRIAELLRRERASVVDVLLALVEFDRLAMYRQLGHASLFDFLHKELGLSRGMAHYRVTATRLMERFPEVVEPLRDGRLCISSVIELGKVITEANRAEVLPKFFDMSRQEAKQVAAEFLPAAVVPVRTVVTSGRASSTVELGLTGVRTAIVQSQVERPVAPAPRTVVEPLTREESRMHVTVSPPFLALLKKARAGQSHVQPGATDEQVLTAALELLIAQQAKRRASVPPRVKREVMKRDEGKCTWPLASGGVCGSMVRLEVDHVVPRGKGGPSSVDNCRILCRAHNLEAARMSYGDDRMDLFAPRNPAVREPLAAYGYATKVSIASSLAVAPAVANPVAGVPVRTTRKFAPTRSWKSAGVIAAESNDTCMATGPAPAGGTTLATGYRLSDPFAWKPSWTVPVKTCWRVVTFVEDGSRVRVAEVTAIRDGFPPSALTASFVKAP